HKDAKVIIQMAIARRRPIDCLLQRRLRAKGQGRSKTDPTLCTLLFALSDSIPSPQIAAANTPPTRVTTASRPGSISKAPPELRSKEKVSPAPGPPRDKFFRRFPAPWVIS